MNKLGPELTVAVTSSENASRYFSKVVKDPFIVPLFEILREPIRLSIQADDAFVFTINTVWDEDFTATAMHFDVHNHRNHYVVLGGDMGTTKEISPIEFKALYMLAKDMKPPCTLNYDALKQTATYKSYGHTESAHIYSLKDFSKLCSCIDSILSGKMVEKLKSKCCEGGNEVD